VAQHSPRSAAPTGRPYERHRPEETVLYRTIHAHWPQFEEHAEATGGLPRFVVREVEEYLRCGLLAHGCVRVGCSALRLNVHFTEGESSTEPRDRARWRLRPLARERRAGLPRAAAPSAEEITDVATRTAQRVQKILACHGRTVDGTGESDAEEPHGEQLALAALCGAATAGHGLTGNRAGEPLLRVVDPARARKAERGGESGARESAWQCARRRRRPGA
jgi:hypothetical protein